MKFPANVPESSDMKSTGSLNVSVGPSARISSFSHNRKCHMSFGIMGFIVEL